MAGVAGVAVRAYFPNTEAAEAEDRRVKPPSATCRVLGHFGLCSKILSLHRPTARKSNKKIAKQGSCSGSIIFYKWKFEEVSLKEIYSVSIPLDTKHIFFCKSE